MQYFNATMTADQVKTTYRDLAKRFHPDLNPNTRAECEEVMKQVNVQYETAVKLAYRNESGDKYSASVETAIVDLAPIISEIVVLPDIDIEVCGSWIWVGGNTKPVKDTLYNLGFKWSANKRMWYFSQNLKGKKRGHYNINQIRSIHGSQKVDKKQTLFIG